MDCISYLSAEGELTETGEEIWKHLDKYQKLLLYKKMKFVRLFDRRMVLWQRQGRIGTYAPLEGQEAAQIGSAYALEKRDWIFPSYRELGVAFTLGIPISSIIRYWRGQIEGCKPPDGYHFVPPTVPIATHLPQAVGAAWAIQKKKQNEVAVAFFGDGATSEGDFHEALNFASLFQLPVLFFCQNNGYAISVPFARQSATETVAEKAKAYNLEAKRIDGNDILAIYATMKQAKQNRKPILIEAVTYRTGAHTTADDASRYRSEVEVRKWLNRDPLYRYEQLLSQEKLLDCKAVETWDREMEQELDEAMRLVESAAHVQYTHLLFEHVYAKLPSSIVEQREEAINANPCTIYR